MRARRSVAAVREGGVEAPEVHHDPAHLALEIRVVLDLVGARRELSLQLVEQVLDGAVARAVRRPRHDAVPGGVDRVHDEHRVVRREIVPEEDALLAGRTVVARCDERRRSQLGTRPGPRLLAGGGQQVWKRVRV